MFFFSMLLVFDILLYTSLSIVHNSFGIVCYYPQCICISLYYYLNQRADCLSYGYLFSFIVVWTFILLWQIDWCQRSKWDRIPFSYDEIPLQPQACGRILCNVICRIAHLIEINESHWYLVSETIKKCVIKKSENIVVKSTYLSRNFLIKWPKKN